jgi:hypothetical protein
LFGGGTGAASILHQVKFEQQASKGERLQLFLQEQTKVFGNGQNAKQECSAFTTGSQHNKVDIKMKTFLEHNFLFA